MKILFLISALGLAMARPQDEITNNQPTPYSFSYGVSDANSGDEKEHKEIVLPSGAIEGEFRWLQPNGLFRTTRYTADDVSGYRAIVSEEPGDRVANYYANSLAEGSIQATSISRGVPQASTNLRSGNKGIASPETTQSQGPRRVQVSPSPKPVSFTAQTIRNQGAVATVPQNQAQQVSVSRFSAPQNTPSQIVTAFISTQSSQNEGNIIDGGIIDGGIIDGGIIDGGIIGSTSPVLGSGSNLFTPSTNALGTDDNTNSAEITSSNPAQTSNRVGNTGSSNRDISKGIAVILARDSSQLRNQ